MRPRRQLSRYDIGRVGEEAGTRFLIQQGYSIIARNFRYRNSELDCVALDPSGRVCVFVEIKTRTSHQYGTPLESVTPKKLRNLVRATETFRS